MGAKGLLPLLLSVVHLCWAEYHTLVMVCSCSSPFCFNGFLNGGSSCRIEKDICRGCSFALYPRIVVYVENVDMELEIGWHSVLDF